MRSKCDSEEDRNIMNATSRAIPSAVHAADTSLTTVERSEAQRLIDGQVEARTTVAGGADEWLLVTQHQAAVLLSIIRAKIWRMTNDSRRSTVGILPGTCRLLLEIHRGS